MADYSFEIIESNECIGNSLSTLNSNFVGIVNQIAGLDTKIKTVSANDLQKIVQLVPGNNVTISPTEVQGVYLIDASLAGSAGSVLSNTAVISGANVGTAGAKIFKRKAPDRFLEFRRLVSGGSNLVISEEGDLIKFTAFDSSGRTGGEVNTTVNAGSGVGVAMTKIGPTLPFKSLVPGRGISITSQPSSVLITNTLDANGLNTGAGANILKTSFENTLTFRSLISGSSNVRIREKNDEIELAVIETLSAQNTNVGVGLFKEKDPIANKLIFKGLVGTTALTAADLSPCQVLLTPTTNSVVLTVFDKISAVNAPVSTFVPPSRGEAGKIVKNKVGNTLNFKSIVPGNNIHITNSANSNEIIISTAVTAPSGGEVNLGINVGGGREVFKEKNGVELVFRTLSAGPGIGLVQQSDTILISGAAFPSTETFVTKTSLTGYNIGGAAGLYHSVSGSGLVFKSLSAVTPYITILNSPSTQTVTLSVGNVISRAQNHPAAGATGGIFKEQSGDTILFRKIQAGAGITVTEDTGNLTISNTYSAPAYLTNIGNGFKNKIINGNFDIWQWQKQVNTTAFGTLSTAQVSSVTFTGNANQFGYLADRVGVLAGSKSAGITDPVVTVNKLNIDFPDTTASGALSACAPSYGLRVILGTRAQTTFVPTIVGQRIENVRALAGKTVTFSFWAKSNNIGSNQVNISYTQCYKNQISQLNTTCLNYYGDAGRTLIPVTIHNNWNRHSVTFTIPEISEAFWQNIWGNNKEEPFWNSFTQISIEIPGTQTRYVDLAGLQLEENTVVTDFEKRPYAIELALCQRYFEIGDRIQTQFATNETNLTYTSFKVTKRTAPTMLAARGVLFKNTNVTNVPNIFVTEHVYDTTSIDSFTTAFTGQNVIVNSKPFIYNWAASAEF
jgi:hypothetical protein